MRRAAAGGTAVGRGGLVRHFFRLLNEPDLLARFIGMKLPFGSFELRSDLDLYPRPHYAYGIQQAATLAKRLGHTAVTVLELGVAGGDGLIKMERLARVAGAALDIRVDVYGFDRAVGLPEPADFRDLPYHWQAGFFEMDVHALRRRLSDARLVIGDLAETVPQFADRADVAPIGFAAVDVDLYSSTVDALRLFDAPAGRLLPRVWCYLDDTVGEDYVLHNQYVGMLAAVREFNEQHDSRKVTAVNGLAHKRLRRAAWCDAMFALHCFDHPDYGRYVGPDPEGQRQALGLSGPPRRPRSWFGRDG